MLIRKTPPQGSRIDHAGHSNDLVGHVHEILAWNDAIQVIKVRCC